MALADAKALILWVDDDKNILTAWRMRLEGEGYRVLAATDGNQALRLFPSHAVDEVVLDYEIPGMTSDVIAGEMPR